MSILRKTMFFMPCLALALLSGCIAIQETTAGSLALLKEKIGGTDTTSSPALAPPPSSNMEEMLDAEIESNRFTKIWHGMEELASDYDDVLAGNDKSWFGHRSKKLTESALKLIASKAGIESYEKILDLQDKLAEAEQKKTELIASRLGYPVNSLNPLAMTREKCDKQIQKIQENIDTFNIEIKKQTTILLHDLNRHGQIVDAKHLNYLLTAAGGDDIMSMMNLAIILKQVQYAIGKQIKMTSQFNGAQLQRYVGIQLVLLLAYEQAHVVAMENIQKKYLPRLQEIRKSAEANLQETKKLHQSSQEGENYLVQNMRISENTIKIAGQYRTALEEMGKSLEKSRSKVQRNVAITRNTFKTVSTGASLLKLIQDSSQDYSELVNFNPPLLDTIYSDQMMEAFQQVSAQLKK